MLYHQMWWGSSSATTEFNLLYGRLKRNTESLVCTYARIVDVYMETQTREKAREPTDFELSIMWWELQWRSWRQQPRPQCLRQQAVTREWCFVPISLSLSLSVHTLTVHTIMTTTITTTNNCFCPTCIYIYTNFGLITNIVSLGS